MDKIGVADWSKFITNSLDPDMIKDWACTIVVLAFAIYYFLFFWVSKEITYFWLSLFAFSICHDFAIWPLFSAGILPLAYYSGGAIYNTSILLQLLFLSLFFRTLIETKTFFPRSDRLFVAFQLGYLCLIAVNLAESLKWPSSKHFDLLSFPPDGKGDILLTYHQLLLLVVFPMLLGTFQIYKKWRAGSRSAGMAMIAFLSLAPIIPLRFLLVDILIMDLVAKSLQLLMFLLLGLSVAQRINDLKKLAIEQQVRLTEAYQRFVPKQLLSNLEKESILDVQLGDQVQKEMSILFSDIRSFTTLSESMSPEENFKFVNSYLKHMGPLVREHNGYIDKFIGDAIMALFDQSPEDAVKTAVAMLETLTDYNDGRERAGYEPIRIGVGVNTGMMMLGTLGESDRMEGSVISDAVNLAARLEGLTKLYQIPLLISETTMQQLPTDSFSIRLIDRVSVKGKKDPILVYEVLNPELPKIREGKINNIENFNKGFDLYQNQQFEKALVRFSKCFETVNEDKVCELYIHRCKNLISNGWDPETWDGVNYMDTK
jgi:class 3 adenylate cyclase